MLAGYPFAPFAQSFQLGPIIQSNNLGDLSTSLIVVIGIIGAVLILLPVLISRLQKFFMGAKSIPKFSKDNFYKFAAKSGLSRETSQYILRKTRGYRRLNPMSIFFNQANMMHVFKDIYQQEKRDRVNSPAVFQENIALLIDAIDTLEKHFQSVSAVLNTYLIPQNTKVFLSDLKNSFRIQMLTLRSSPRTLVLSYKYSPKNNDARLRKVGRQLTLWLIDSTGSGYAAYHTYLKRIRRFSKERKEYHLSHSWRQEIPNITRKYKRVNFSQRCRLLPTFSAEPIAKNASKTISKMINGLMVDVSLGGCSVAVSLQYQEALSKGLRVAIKFPNPLQIGKPKSRHIQEFYQLEGRITRVTPFSDRRYEGLCNAHVRFHKMERIAKNSLGLFIYNLEYVRISEASYSPAR